MRKTSFKGQRCWLIGASSGIGEAVAKKLVEQGAIVALSGRRANALRELAADLANHPGCTAAPLDMPCDLAKPETIESSVEQLQTAWPKIDHVINFAGVYEPMHLDNLDLEKVQQMLTVNVGGNFALLDKIYPVLKKQGHGQLAIVGSISAYIGLPYGQPYAATKAAIRNLAESLYAESANTGVQIKLINPGFVETDLTNKNDFKMPALLQPHEAAEYIVKGMMSRRFEVHFPGRFSYVVKTIGNLPYWASLPILKKIARSRR